MYYSIMYQSCLGIPYGINSPKLDVCAFWKMRSIFDKYRTAMNEDDLQYHKTDVKYQMAGKNLCDQDQTTAVSRLMSHCKDNGDITHHITEFLIHALYDNEYFTYIIETTPLK